MKAHHLLVPLLTTTLAAQSEIWVDPVNGNDANPGTYTLPVRTLGYAVGIAVQYDRIMLLPGTYGPSSNGETLPIRVGTAPQPDLEIRGIGDVVFDLAAGTGTFMYLVDGADRLHITNITVRNMDQLGWWTRMFNSGNGVNSANSAVDVEIDRCKFIDVNRVFVFWTSDVVAGWRVHDNLFVNCANDAILEYTGTNDFYNNTFYGGAYKAYISDSIDSRFYDNVIASYSIAFECNNSANQMNRYQGNWMYQCATLQQGPGMVGALPATNTVGVDPQFVNATNRDFHLLATSPLIDTGVAPFAARADLDANSRIVDANQDGILTIDAGCYEWTPIHLTATWDPLTQLLWFDGTSTLPGTYAFVPFCFDDGVIQFPGQGPILLHQPTYFNFFFQGMLPAQWVISLSGVVLPPGMRLVAQILGVGPNPAGPAVIGGNQIWHQI